jgi:hypothetical protein
VHRYRDGENPAARCGNLDKLLPQRSKVRKVKHHPALPHDELLRPISTQTQMKTRNCVATF